MDYFHFSINNIKWDYGVYDGWIGGKMPVSNLSTGYHGIQKQWWDYYLNKENKVPNVLLISESNNVRNDFLEKYPNWNIELIDLYPEINNEKSSHNVIVGDICALQNPLQLNKYDLIINQATLEHVYNPFQAMSNLLSALVKGGILITHTHPPGFPYHQYPHDYFRFMRDWWIYLSNYIKNIQLLEFLEYDKMHVFTCYIKS
jgi:SAM-dependent methyltransferase